MPFSPILSSNLDRTSFFHQGTTGEKLEILYSDSEADLVNGYVIYRGGVKATYGPTVLKTDLLIVRQGNPGDDPVSIQVEGKSYTLRPLEAYAVGKVDVVDPDGTVKATNLWFTWDKARRDSAKEIVGRAESVEIRIASSYISGDKMSQSKSGIAIEHASFHNGKWNPPLYQLDADSVFVEPGSKATAKNVRLKLFGVALPLIPRYVISLDPRAGGVQIPRFGYRQGAGLGMSWSGEFLASDATDIAGSFTSFPNVQPTYGITYAKSIVPIESSAINQFAVTDQFGERSAFSHFTNIYVNSLDQAYERIRNPKNLFSAASSFNAETVSRVTDRRINYTEPLELGYEKGGPAGQWGYLVQAKTSRIVEGGDLSANRVMFQGSLFAPLVHSGRFSLGTRFDGVSRFDRRTSGYVGAEGGISYQALRDLSLGVGIYGYHNFGVTTFQGDNFVSNQGFSVRGDLLGSATQVSVMYRYDPSLGWFDRQYRISQVVGPIEPVFAFRESPRHYELGFNFRLDNISNLLQRRHLNRDTTNSADKTPNGGSQ